MWCVEDVYGRIQTSEYTLTSRVGKRRVKRRHRNLLFLVLYASLLFLLHWPCGLFVGLLLTLEGLDRYCDNRSVCFTCSYCVNTNNDAIDGTCPAYCYTATNSSPPSRQPTRAPTSPPSRLPTHTPTRLPTQVPTGLPTGLPTRVPSTFPSLAPTRSPTTQQPTTSQPMTNEPTADPIASLSGVPSPSPTVVPTGGSPATPERVPTGVPNLSPLPPLPSPTVPNVSPTTPTSFQHPSHTPTGASAAAPSARPAASAATTTLPLTEPLTTAETGSRSEVDGANDSGPVWVIPVVFLCGLAFGVAAFAACRYRSKQSSTYRPRNIDIPADAGRSTCVTATNAYEAAVAHNPTYTPSTESFASRYASIDTQAPRHEPAPCSRPERLRYEKPVALNPDYNPARTQPPDHGPRDPVYSVVYDTVASLRHQYSTLGEGIPADSGELTGSTTVTAIQRGTIYLVPFEVGQSASRHGASICATGGIADVAIDDGNSDSGDDADDYLILGEENSQNHTIAKPSTPNLSALG